MIILMTARQIATRRSCLDLGSTGFLDSYFLSRLYSKLSLSGFIAE
jgi:hypothetical protein